jgi:2C-methyl-D-erythritol 2,4-cyclodiphosphate synthase
MPCAPASPSAAGRCRPGRVNVKAKTAERVGPVGAGVAIEALAGLLAVAG